MNRKKKKRGYHLRRKAILRCTRGVNETAEDNCDAIFSLYNIGLVSLCNHSRQKHPLSPAPVSNCSNCIHREPIKT